MSLNFSKLRRVLIPIGIVLWVFVGFMLAQAIGIALVQVLNWAGVPLKSIGATLFNTLANIVIYALAVLIIVGVPWWLKKWKTTRAEVGLDRLPKWMDLAWLSGGAVTYMILTMIITSIAMHLIPGADYNQVQNTGFTGAASQSEVLLAFFSLIIVAPVAEEIIFRGYLLGKLRKHAPTWVAVILTAGLFAVAHGQFNVGLDTFALGIVLCLLRVYSGSLWASILLHMLKNGIAFYFLFVNPSFL